jgi:hypothetical protein
MLVTIELGYRVGRRSHGSADSSSRAQVKSIQASLLGILALLLGFTFSLALQRFDSRSAAVVHEANAIGTAWLRAKLLPAPLRGKTADLLRQYLDLRVVAGGVSLDHHAERDELLARSNALVAALWEEAAAAAVVEPNPVTTGLYVQSLNDLIDAYGVRDAALNRHVPEVVLRLLYGTFLMAGTILGYASGVAGHRAPAVTYILVGLIVLLVFNIIDLDRPRRGLIEVSQRSMLDLQTTIRAESRATGD